MVQLNWTIIIIAALVPTVTGMIWYNPKVFGTAWMNLTGLTEEQLQKGSMGKKIALSLIFSFMISLAMNPIVIHQMGVFSTLAGEPGIFDATTGSINQSSEAGALLTSFMETYGDRFRTFKHGAFHGTLFTIFLILPIMAINNTFEGKPFKLTLIHAGYWALTLALMGGLICQFR